MPGRKMSHLSSNRVHRVQKKFVGILWLMRYEQYECNMQIVNVKIVKNDIRCITAHINIARTGCFYPAFVI